MNKRKTICLPRALLEELRSEASRRGISASALAREALAVYLPVAEAGKRHIPWAAMGHSGETDVSERVKEILSRELSNDYDRQQQVVRGSPSNSASSQSLPDLQSDPS